MTEQRLKFERDIAVAALREIKRATIEGRVCDDVAWFSKIETLHDFCEGVLDRVREHRFEDAGFDTCRFCGERGAHTDHINVVASSTALSSQDGATP